MYILFLIQIININLIRFSLTCFSKQCANRCLWWTNCCIFYQPIWLNANLCFNLNGFILLFKKQLNSIQFEIQLFYKYLNYSLNNYLSKNLIFIIYYFISNQDFIILYYTLCNKLGTDYMIIDKYLNSNVFWNSFVLNSSFIFTIYKLILILLIWSVLIIENNQNNNSNYQLQHLPSNVGPSWFNKLQLIKQFGENTFRRSGILTQIHDTIEFSVVQKRNQRFLR